MGHKQHLFPYVLPFLPDLANKLRQALAVPNRLGAQTMRFYSLRHTFTSKYSLRHTFFILKILGALSVQFSSSQLRTPGGEKVIVDQGRASQTKKRAVASGEQNERG